MVLEVVSRSLDEIPIAFKFFNRDSSFATVSSGGG